MGLKWDWSPSEFQPNRFEYLRAVVETPEGWNTLEFPRDNAVAITNYMGGVVVVERMTGQIGWIFRLPIVELKHQFEEMYRQGMERELRGRGRTWEDPWEGRGKREITSFEASEIPIADGKALQLRFVVRTRIELLYYFLVPVTTVDDTYHEEIYLPLDKPFDYIAPQAAP